MANKYITNSFWIISGKIIEVILAFFVGIITARYLGPSNYGLINYAGAYVTFFTPIATLGLDSIAVNELLEKKDRQGEVLGTITVLKLVSSFISVFCIAVLILVIDFGETEVFLIAVLYSLKLVFQSFQTFQYWYQSKLMSKRNVVVHMIAYVVMSGYKIILLVMNKSVYWFAFSVSVDMIVSGIGMIALYKYDKGEKLSFSFKTAKELIKKSQHFIWSGLIITIYAKIDTIMIKHMLNDVAVGHYSSAYTLAGYMPIVLSAVVESCRPAIISAKSKSQELYARRNRQLYALIIWIGAVCAVGVALFAKLVISILYGSEFMPAAPALKILVWFVIFSQLGVARNIWIICENKQKYVKYFSIVGTVVNIVLNSFMLPIWGILGASVATLITEFVVGFLMSYVIRDTRQSAVYMLDALLMRNVLSSDEKNMIKKKMKSVFRRHS